MAGKSANEAMRVPMSSLFDKLNTLVNAQVNDLLGKNPRSPLARIKLKQDDAEQAPRQSARTLRHRLEDAIAYEDELQAKIDGLLRKAEALDEQVDRAISIQDELGARRLQEQLIMQQRQLAIAESELRDHRRVTGHLMTELRNLEGALDRQERDSASRSAGPGNRQRIPLDEPGQARSPRAAGSPSIVDSVTGKLDEAREGLEDLLKRSPVPQPPPKSSGRQRFDIIDEAPDPRKPKPPKTEASDMKNRLSRLSKPDAD